MNRFVEEHGSVYRETQVMREQLLDILTDADLAYTPGGANPTLGALCKEMGDVEYSYLQSFKTLKQDWSYRHPDAALATRVSSLRGWYQQLDHELQDLMEGFSDADLTTVIDRGFPATFGTQLHIYREALLIFYAKVAVYLKGMNKPLPEQWKWWIG